MEEPGGSRVDPKLPPSIPSLCFCIVLWQTISGLTTSGAFPENFCPARKNSHIGFVDKYGMNAVPCVDPPVSKPCGVGFSCARTTL